MVILEYPEDLDRNLIKPEDLKILRIVPNFSLFANKFKLKGVINFQGMYYICHINGIYHKKLIPKINKWFYHDGKFNDSVAKTQGMLTPGEPNLHIDMATTKVRPYILIYKEVDL